MIAEKPEGMKYITRLSFSSNSQGWRVVIFGKRGSDSRISKYFADTKYGTAGKSLKEAKTFRDKRFAKLTRAQRTIPHAARKGGIYGEGVYIQWKTRGKWSYPHAVATWIINNKQRRQSFSINKYGYDEAMEKAKSVRKKMTHHKKRD